MEIALLCKAVGGVLAGIAHRHIVRVARREGFWWAAATMALPGFSLVFAFIHRVDLKRALLVQLAGFTLLGGAFFLHVAALPARLAQHQPQPAKAGELQSEEAAKAQRAREFAQMTPEQKQERLKTWYQQLAMRRKVLKNAQEISAFNLEAQQYHALLHELSNGALATGADPEKLARRAQWYEELCAKRDKLDPKNPAEMMAFNQEVARYQASASENANDGSQASK